MSIEGEPFVLSDDEEVDDASLRQKARQVLGWLEARRFLKDRTDRPNNESYIFLLSFERKQEALNISRKKLGGGVIAVGSKLVDPEA